MDEWRTDEWQTGDGVFSPYTDRVLQACEEKQESLRPGKDGTRSYLPNQQVQGGLIVQTAVQCVASQFWRNFVGHGSQNAFKGCDTRLIAQADVNAEETVCLYMGLQTEGVDVRNLVISGDRN